MKPESNESTNDLLIGLEMKSFQELSEEEIQTVQSALVQLASEPRNQPSDQQFQKWQGFKDTRCLEDFSEIALTDANGPQVFNALLELAGKNRPWAQRFISEFYADQSHPEHDPAEALKWAAKAASHGIPELVDNLMHGVLRDVYRRAETVKNFRGGAYWDYPEPQFQLGFVYHDGQGVDVNLDLARYWWRRAKDNGHERASQLLSQIDEYEEK